MEIVAYRSKIVYLKNELGCMWRLGSSVHVAFIGENTCASISLTQHHGIVFENLGQGHALVSFITLRYLTFAPCEYHSLTDLLRLVC